jgi:flagellar FliJ protein
LKKSQRIQPVVKVAENHEQQAAQVLGKAQAALTQAEQRLQELQTYRNEYVRRFQEAGAAGMGAVRMEDYRRFLHNLSQAIEQQMQVVAGKEREVEAQRRQWHTRRSKVKMLDNVVARYVLEEQRKADKKEQAEQDERALHPPVK